MQKTELIARVAKETGVSQVEATKVVNGVLKVILESLKSKEKVTLTGFGTFEVRETSARTGTNPRTREKINIPAGRRVTFNAGTELRNAVSGKEQPKSNRGGRSGRSGSGGSGGGNRGGGGSRSGGSGAGGGKSSR